MCSIGTNAVAGVNPVNKFGINSSNDAILFGLNLVVAAIVLWNTIYLGRAIQGLREQGLSVDERLLAHVSPLGWEHINLTGDYVWHSNKRVAKGRFRPLRSSKDSVTRLFTPQPKA